MRAALLVALLLAHIATGKLTTRPEGGWSVAHALVRHKRHKKSVALQEVAETPSISGATSIHLLLYPRYTISQWQTVSLCFCEITRTVSLIVLPFLSRFPPLPLPNFSPSLLVVTWLAMIARSE